MKPKEQLERWVAGESVHNGATRVDGECCPDFSCCHPASLWPQARREFFRDHPKARDEMLFQSLGAAVSVIAPDVDVHLVGG